MKNSNISILISTVTFIYYYFTSNDHKSMNINLKIMGKIMEALLILDVLSLITTWIILRLKKRKAYFSSHLSLKIFL